VARDWIAATEVGFGSAREMPIDGEAVGMAGSLREADLHLKPYQL